MTKDAKKLLCCMYAIYKKQSKTLSRDLAKETTENLIIEVCNELFNAEDVPDLINELITEKFIYQDGFGGIYIDNPAIEYVENLSKSEFKELLQELFKILSFFK